MFRRKCTMNRAIRNLTLPFPKSLFLGLLLAFAASIPAGAQFTTARLGGTVADSSGSAIPGATMIVKSLETGYSQSATSGEGGAYLFPSLPVGTYRLTATMTGFAEYV